MKRAAMCLVVLLVACDAPDRATSLAEPVAPPVPQSIEVFSDLTRASGLNFVHENGASGELYFPEIMGSGVALFDYDGDGDLDIYAVQSAKLPAVSRAGSSAASPAPGNRLYRNDLLPGGEPSFSDVTLAAGVADPGYGMGAAVADWDNDGDQDLYVTNFGPNVMYRNNGDGTFSDITSDEERGDDSWSTSASFVDYDLDGDLDLYVANYVAFSVKNNIACTGHAGQRDYCSPATYAPQRDRFWRNDGNAFVDVSLESGIGKKTGNGLGVIAADFNGDSWPDIYVANDQVANMLWINQGDGTFDERALILGCAYNADGAPEASMGITSADYDGDGDEDLFMTHLGRQTNTIYRNDGEGSFVDLSNASGLAVPSLGYTGFGTRWFDVDNDGRLDLFSANGAVQIEPSQMATVSYPYLQRNQLFLQQADGRFVDASAWSGKAMRAERVGRGAAFGDIDNDGAMDIVVSNNSGPLALLINNETGSAWLRIGLTGTASNRDGAGARVAVMKENDPVYWRRAHSDGSYLSASDRRLHFGLSRAEDIDGVLVIWPSGREERWDVEAINREVWLVEGSGK